MIDQELLSMLVCPEDKSPVTLADDAMMEKVNAAIHAGSLKNRAGDAVEESAEAGLIREDGQYLYLIRHDIPIMLIDESVPLEQLD